jgi:hypothetical protein
MCCHSQISINRQQSEMPRRLIEDWRGRICKWRCYFVICWWASFLRLDSDLFLDDIVEKERDRRKPFKIEAITMDQLCWRRSKRVAFTTSKKLHLFDFVISILNDSDQALFTQDFASQYPSKTKYYESKVRSPNSQQLFAVLVCENNCLRVSGKFNSCAGKFCCRSRDKNRTQKPIIASSFMKDMMGGRTFKKHESPS